MKVTETYRSGIYNRLEAPPDSANPLWYFLPGLVHIFASDQKGKGLALFCGALICLTNLILFFFDLPCPRWCQTIGFQKLVEVYNQSSLYFKLGYGAVITAVLAYILNENKKDLDLSFYHLEVDGKPVIIGSSISGSYLISLSLLGFIFLYGVLNLIKQPEQKALEIEMTTFVNNPYQKNEPKKAPNVNRISSQNALDSGRFDRNKPVAPEQNRSVAAPKPRTNPNPQQVQAQPQPRSQPKQASKPQQQSPYQRPAPQPKQQSAPPIPQPKQIEEQIAENPYAKPKLPSFKPKASSENATNSASSASNSSSTSKPAEIAYNSPYGGGQPALRAPVLAPGSRTGGFSSSQGAPGNAAPNNNPNGPVSVAAKRGPVDYGPFMQDLQRRIQQAWHPSKNVREEQVVLTFELYKSGKLVPGSLRTLSSSTQEAEDAAKQAVLAAAAGFRPLPEGAADQVRIDFTFTKTGIRSIGRRY
ncbi:MAG: TonB C-terminal domain-containing protein [Candidatus Caenarcaniphilales bacterium]|nr:TonB C-terminal domain-containing protein [Candidatus Caenarcaniphilales bacterium]